MQYHLNYSYQIKCEYDDLNQSIYSYSLSSVMLASFALSPYINGDTNKTNKLVVCETLDGERVLVSVNVVARLIIQVFALAFDECKYASCMHQPQQKRLTKPPSHLIVLVVIT